MLKDHKAMTPVVAHLRMTFIRPGESIILQFNFITIKFHSLEYKSYKFIDMVCIYQRYLNYQIMDKNHHNFTHTHKKLKLLNI